MLLVGGKKTDMFKHKWMISCMHKQEIALPTAKSLGSKDTSILKFIKSVLNLMKLFSPFQFTARAESSLSQTHLVNL